MLPSFIITFREALEAALIIGIILSFLIRTKQTKYNNVVYMGIASGITASVIGAFLFVHIANGFTGRAEEIFEGITMLLGAALLTTMIFWMLKQKHIARNLQNKVQSQITKASQYGLFFLVFISILREGIETTIFLGAANFVSAENNLIGALLGLVAAIILGYLLFVSTRKINLKKFFTVTSILLILFAAGLVAHGLHELQEASVIPTVIEHVWDINPTVVAGFPLLHEKGYIGSILKGLFGYNGNPSLIEVLSYLAYLGFVYLVWKRIEQSKVTRKEATSSQKL